MATVQETARLQVKAIRARKLVPELRVPALKAVRCLYTDVFRSVVLPTAIRIVGINVSVLEGFDNGSVITVETLVETGIIKNPRDGVKILGNGELTKKLTVKANAFSENAKAKIEAAGGTYEVI